MNRPLVTQSPTDSVPPAQEAGTGSTSDGPGEHWRWCPRCSHELHNEKCKLRCPRCHYFMSCSDFD
jgi:hypothetical protein